MKCLNCGKEFEAKRKTAKYCTPACKLAYHRGKVSVTDDTLTIAEPVSVSVYKSRVPYEIVVDQKVYNRQAVRYHGLSESWDLRPIPESMTDEPVIGTRGRYIREDGTKYQIDATGQIISLAGTGEKPANYGQDDCQCKHCQQNRNMGGKLIINHGAYKDKLGPNEVNRVSLPGDSDYESIDPMAAVLMAG